MDKKQKRIGIYSPYLDTAGGGERYFLTIAECLSKENQVDFILGTHLYNQEPATLTDKISTLHNLDLTKVNFIKGPFGKKSSLFDRIFFLQKYDYFFYLTDGSIFFSTAKKSFIHFQVPFKNTTALGLWGKFKLSSFKKAIYNSKFTKGIVEQTWPIKGEVIYPPVDSDTIKPKPKKKQILSVGRFFGFLKDKKHSLLIKVFKELSNDGKLNDWSLILIGAASEGDQDYINQLKEEAKEYPIEFYPNAPYKQLKEFYESSSIYWHALGFGEEDPVKMEHFGISTVEAMAGGCVPVVINKGGLVEIVEDEKSGLFWDDTRELKQKTLELTSQNNKFERLSKNAISRSKGFSKDKFVNQIMDLLND